MNDVLAFLGQGQNETVSKDPDQVKISFITSDLYSFKNLEKNILKIDDIGEEIGYRFEIIVAGKENNNYDNMLFSDLERKLENLTIVRVKSGNQGMAKRIATNVSSGNFLVFFESSLSYSIEFADIIASYLRSGEKSVLLSDLIVMPRDLFFNVGGFRDLRYAEDIDLLARIYMSANTIAYPVLGCKMLITQGIPLFGTSTEPWSDLSGSGFKIRKAQRDQILACNYRISDINGFAAEEKSRGLFAGIVVKVQFFFARRLRISPTVHDQNNFLILMDKILESLVLKDYMRFDGINMKPMLSMPGALRNYLSKASVAWKSHEIDNILTIE